MSEQPDESAVPTAEPAEDYAGDTAEEVVTAEDTQAETAAPLDDNDETAGNTDNDN
jgi:hypothetical protein